MQKHSHPIARIVAAIRTRDARGLSTPDLILGIALIIGVIGAGTMMIQAGSGQGNAATAAPAKEAVAPSASEDEAAKAKPVKRTTKSRLRTLRHPLIGVSRQKLIARLGKPTRRTTEGGAALELLEYEIANHEYQLVLLNKRVVEVNQFR